MNQIEKAVADLRHAYHQLVEGVVKDQAKFADGLIAPAIAAIEQALKPGEPVAWGMVNSRSGQIYDCISPAQHAEHEGSYTVPLYTAPQPQPCKPAEDGVCEALECCKDKLDHWRNNADCERQRAEDAKALLLEATGLLMQMPIKHPQQGEYREDLIKRIGEHIK